MTLHYSRPFAGFVLVVVTVISVHLATTTFRVLAFGGAISIFGVLWTLVWAPFAVSLYRRYLRAWSFKGPVVTIDAKGITDIREPHPFVDWEHVENVYLSRSAPIKSGAMLLCIEFRSTEVAKDYLHGPYFLQRAYQKWHFAGHWNVSLRALSCSSFDVLRTAAAYHRKSITDRARPVESAPRIHLPPTRRP